MASDLWTALRRGFLVNRDGTPATGVVDEDERPSTGGRWDSIAAVLPEEEEFSVVDFASGDGTYSLRFAVRFPLSAVLSIETRPKQRADHFKRRDILGLGNNVIGCGNGAEAIWQMQEWHHVHVVSDLAG